MLGNVVRFLIEFQKRANFYCNISPTQQKCFLNGWTIQRGVYVDRDLSFSLYCELSLDFLVPFFAFTKSEKQSCLCSFRNKVVFHKKSVRERNFPPLILTVLGGCGRVILQRWLPLANAGSFHVCFCLSSQGALLIHIPIPSMILLLLLSPSTASIIWLTVLKSQLTPQLPGENPNQLFFLCVQNPSLLTLQ